MSSSEASEEDDGKDISEDRAGSCREQWTGDPSAPRSPPLSLPTVLLEREPVSNEETFPTPMTGELG